LQGKVPSDFSHVDRIVHYRHCRVVEKSDTPFYCYNKKWTYKTKIAQCYIQETPKDIIV